MGLYSLGKRLCCVENCKLTDPLKVFAVPSIVFYTMAAAFGIGNHIQVVLLAPNLAYGTLWEWVAAATISFSVGAAKTSVMLYILTIQDRTHKIGRQILWTVVTVNVRPISTS